MSLLNENRTKEKSSINSAPTGGYFTMDEFGCSIWVTPATSYSIPKIDHKSNKIEELEESKSATTDKEDLQIDSSTHKKSSTISYTPPFLKLYYNKTKMLNVMLLQFLSFKEIFKLSMLSKKMQSMIDPLSSDMMTSMSMSTSSPSSTSHLR